MSFNLAQANQWYELSRLTPASRYGPPLLIPTAKYSDALLETLNGHLANAESGWRLKLEGPATNPVVTALVLTPPDDPVPNDPVRVPADAVPLFRARDIDLASDLVALGAPAGKPNAVIEGNMGRLPVTAFADPPRRQDPLALPGKRRPVVALLDTALDSAAPDPAAPWLGESDLDGVWVDASVAYGWYRGPDRWRPPHVTPFGTLDTHVGHGTFSAGIIRQVAPDAQILSIPLMDDDGTVHADHLINALGWLHEKASYTPGFVDIVCCPITLDASLPADATLLGWLRAIMGALGDLGVQVVVAAGNDGTADPTFPGAFICSKTLPRVPLVCVGALNPNGTKAYYSSHHASVTEWEHGTSVVSIVPRRSGAANPELGPSEGHESLDPDHYGTGWARWSGTSFAAAKHAGRLARQWTGP